MSLLFLRISFNPSLLYCSGCANFKWGSFFCKSLIFLFDINLSVQIPREVNSFSGMFFDCIQAKVISGCDNKLFENLDKSSFTSNLRAS